MHEGFLDRRGETLHEQDRLHETVRASVGEHGERPALFFAYRHCAPVRLGRSGRSRQFGRASAPTIP
jgi:hypothetical protein